MIVDGYIRVSKVRGRSGPSFISPVQQREKIELYCQMHDYQLGVVHEELDQSGGRKDRPKLTEAVERIERRETGGLVVAKLDRFGRTLVHGLAMIDRIQEADGVFASVMDSFDTSTSNGRFVLKVMLSLAELELERVRDTFEDARRRAVARGIHPCPVPPAGYTRRGDDDSGLTPHPTWGPVVSELYERAAEGESWADLARWMNSTDIPTAYGNLHWTGRSVKELLRNKAYLGVAHHGPFENPDAHEPLTTPELFTRAARPGVKSTARSDRPSPLAGLLRCGSCRYVMASYFPHGPDAGRYYTCRSPHARGRCSGPARAATSTRIVDVITARFFETVGDIRAVGAAPSPDRLDELTRSAEQAERALAAYRDDAEVMLLLGMERYKRGLREYADAADAAQAELTAERERLGGIGVTEADLRASWPELSVTDRRRLMGLVFDAVFLMPGSGPVEKRLHFCLRGEAPNDMPRRGRKGAVELKPYMPARAA